MISKKQFRSYKIINGKKYTFQKATPKKHIADKEAKRYSPPRMPTAFRPMQNRPLRWRY